MEFIKNIINKILNLFSQKKEMEILDEEISQTEKLQNEILELTEINSAIVNPKIKESANKLILVLKKYHKFCSDNSIENVNFEVFKSIMYIKTAVKAVADVENHNLHRPEIIHKSQDVLESSYLILSDLNKKLVNYKFEDSFYELEAIHQIVKSESDHVKIEN